MQLHLTDGRIGLTVTFSETLDAGKCTAIRASDRPVSKALYYATQRLCNEVSTRDERSDVGTWYPIQGQALEGL